MTFVILRCKNPLNITLTGSLLIYLRELKPSLNYARALTEV